MFCTFLICSVLLPVLLWKEKILGQGTMNYQIIFGRHYLRSGMAFSFHSIFFDPFFLFPWAAEKWWTHIVTETADTCAHEQKVNGPNDVVVFRRTGWEHLGTREGKAHQSFQRSRQHWCLAVYVVNKVCDSCVQEQFSVKCQSTSE